MRQIVSDYFHDNNVKCIAKLFEAESEVKSNHFESNHQNDLTGNHVTNMQRTCSIVVKISKSTSAANPPRERNVGNYSNNDETFNIEAFQEECF